MNNLGSSFMAYSLGGKNQTTQVSIIAFCFSAALNNVLFTK